MLVVVHFQFVMLRLTRQHTYRGDHRLMLPPHLYLNDDCKHQQAKREKYRKKSTLFSVLLSLVSRAAAAVKDTDQCHLFDYQQEQTHIPTASPVFSADWTEQLFFLCLPLSSSIVVCVYMFVVRCSIR